MRLIDADTVIKELEEMANNEWNISVGSSKGLNDAIDVIDNAPTVEERPQGKWIYDGFCCTTSKYKCSACRLPELCRSDYCPNCGAKMKI